VVLEAAYQRNPKPDKAARIDLVRRVALGEKEVQVQLTDGRVDTLRLTDACRYGFRIGDRARDENQDPFSLMKSNSIKLRGSALRSTSTLAHQVLT